MFSKRRIALFLSLHSLLLPTLWADEPALRRLPAAGAVAWQIDSEGVGHATGHRYTLRVTGGRAQFSSTSEDDSAALQVLQLSLASAWNGDRAIELMREPAARREGELIAIDHGAILEQWVPRHHEVEQLFLIPRLDSQAGDLVLRINVESPLRPEQVIDGVQWSDAMGNAQLHYSHLIAIDAHGQRWSGDVKYIGEHLELRVPQAFLQRAAFPVTIDPILRSFNVRSGPVEDHSADTAMDAARDRFAIAFCIGSDIYFRCLTSAGVLLTELALDTTTAQSSVPQIAFARSTVPGVPDGYLIIWHDYAALPASNKIRAILIDANSLTPIGGAFDVAASGEYESSPDVGAIPDGFFLAWDAVPAGGPLREVRMSRFSLATGLVPGIIRPAPGSAHSFSPALPQWMRATAQATPAVVIAYVGDAGIRSSAIGLNGAVLQSDVLLSLPLQPSRRPSLAGNGLDHFVIWESDFRSVGRFVGWNGTLQPRGTALQLGSLEPGGPNAAQRQLPRVATDGVRYVYTVVQREFSDFNVYASVITGGTSPLRFLDARIPIATSEEYEPYASVAMEPFENSPEPGRALICYDVDRARSPSRSGMDIEAVVLDAGSLTGGILTVPTACGGASAPQLVASGTPLLGLGVDFQFSTGAGAIPVLALGAALPTPFPLCAAQSNCALGVSPVLVWLPGSSIVTIAIPADPTVLDFTLAVQGLEIGAGAVTGACTPPLTPLLLRTSDTLLLRPR